MSLTTTQCLFTFVVLCASIHIGASFKCYKCFGTNTNAPSQSPFPGLEHTASCVDPIRTWNLTSDNCPDDKACVRYVKTLGELKVYARGCFSPDTCKNAVDIECKTCKTDFCNSSSSFLPSFTLISVLAFVLAKYY